jgi:hypothetical protein
MEKRIFRRRSVDLLILILSEPPDEVMECTPFTHGLLI